MHSLTVFFITIPKLAQAFGNKSLLRFLFLACAFWYFAVTRKTVFRGKEMKFTLYFLGKMFNVHIESIVDLAVLNEVFVQEEYSWQLQADPKVIIDLGAHFGDTALYYHLKYPEAQIIAVEPAPATFERLCKNVKTVHNIIPVQAGVANKDGFMDLHISPSSIGSSFSDRSDTTQIISIPVLTLRSLLEKYGHTKAGLVKFDIEGAEEMMFENECPEALSSAYIGEVHGDLMSMDVNDFISKFTAFAVETLTMRNKKRLIIKCKANI